MVDRSHLQKSGHPLRFGGDDRSYRNVDRGGSWLSDTSPVDSEGRLDLKKMIMNNKLKEEDGKENGQ